MSPESFQLQSVTRITAGSVGPPGKRVFYLQARNEEHLVTLIVEKGQLQSLAAGLEPFLRDLQRRNPQLTPASSQYRESEMRLEEPLDPSFRIGQLGLGYDEPNDLLILVAKQIQDEGQDPEEASVARFWCTRSQLLAMCTWSNELAGRGRPICGNCGEPIDPEGHFCPKRNGHKS